MNSSSIFFTQKHVYPKTLWGGCLLLKVIDLIIIMLESEKLSSDELQFAYKERSSTTMCSWSVSTVVEYYNRRGAPLYGAAMDMSKAFDMVSWSELFSTLKSRQINPVILRLMLAIYKGQKCKVLWNEKPSLEFRVTNGVRQGGVISAILFSVYINELIEELRKSNLGCHIDGVFLGAFLFADDVFLLSGNIGGLQELVNICSDFASRKNLKFGTDTNIEKSKTKCIAFSKNPREIRNLRIVKLDNLPLPWVTSVKHLGNKLQSDNSMKLDIALKRGQMIGKVNSLLQEFHYLESNVLMKLVNSYATSMYGSPLWPLLSSDSEKLYTTWNVTVRNIFHLDRCTHRLLIEPISEVIHLKTALLSRYMKFIKSLKSCDKPSIQYLCEVVRNDHHSQMGKILTYISQTCDVDFCEIDSLSQNEVKKQHTYFTPSQDDEWKIKISKELHAARRGKFEIPGFKDEEILTIFNFICTK